MVGSTGAPTVDLTREPTRAPVVAGTVAPTTVELTAEPPDHRSASRRAALVAFAMVAVYATQSEVTLWLGGRCELTWVVPGLLGAHAFLTAVERDGGPGVALAALFVGLAALGKEPGFLLPLAYLPLLRGVPLRRALAHLGKVSVLLTPLLAWRVIRLGGLGAYVDEHAARGPAEWAGNLAYGMTTLTLGAVMHWPTWVAIVTPLALGVAIAVALRVTYRSTSRSARRVAPLLGVAFGLAALLAPTALVHEPRTLYGAVAYLVVATGVLAARHRRVQPLVALVLVLHASMAIAGQRLYVEVARGRRALLAELDETLAHPGDDAETTVYLVGPRWRPMGISGGVIADVDRPGPGVGAILAAPYAENDLGLLAPSHVEALGDCRARIEMSIPRGARTSMGARVEPSPRGVEVRFDGPVRLLHHTPEGRARRVDVPCETPR